MPHASELSPFENNHIHDVLDAEYQFNGGSSLMVFDQYNPYFDAGAVDGSNVMRFIPEENCVPPTEYVQWQM